MANNPFIPTPAQHLEAARWLNLGFNIDTVRLRIMNGDDPVSKDTFMKVFAKEIREAQLVNLEEAMACLANAAKTDPNMASRYINTRGRGYFKKRFELDTTQTIKDQYDQVLHAAADGLISSEEAQQYASIIKSKEESALHKLVKLLEGMVDPKKLSDALGDTNAG